MAEVLLQHQPAGLWPPCLPHKSPAVCRPPVVSCPGGPPPQGGGNTSKRRKLDALTYGRVNPFRRPSKPPASASPVCSGETRAVPSHGDALVASHPPFALFTSGQKSEQRPQPCVPCAVEFTAPLFRVARCLTSGGERHEGRQGRGGLPRGPPASSRNLRRCWRVPPRPQPLGRGCLKFPPLAAPPPASRGAYCTATAAAAATGGNSSCSPLASPHLQAPKARR